MVPLTQIVEKIRSYHPAANTDLIHRAYAFSSRSHEGQTRKSGDPYFIHPVSVANVIADLHLDTASVCAALLHDTVEDTSATLDEITHEFGQEIAFLVDGVTKLGRLNFASKEDQQAESFRKMLVAMSSDIRVLLVKLADRLDNMRTLEHMKPESQERIASETVDIYAPLAGRLGIQWMKSELEDLSFQYLHPETYAELVRKSEGVSKDRDKYIQDVARQLETMLIERGFAVEVSGRQKHLYSIYRKMKQSQCEFEQVHDFVAFRVIMETVADCYAALGVVHSQWIPIPGRFKDYIALPKPNMYQSLHTTVIGPGRSKLEVQIRTREMHQTAEYGIAAHWNYKEEMNGIHPKDAAKFTWLRQLMEVQKEVMDPAEFLESVKFDLFGDEVFVFTPKGDVKVFPRGATPVDFAYAIHSEIGEHCTGARVNGSIVPLKYKMRNGDIVDVLTHPQHHPSKDWLDFVTTARARSKIRAYVRTEGRKRSKQLGRNLLEREMQKRNLSFARFIKSDEVQKVVEHFRSQTIDELFVLVGYGKISALEVVEFVSPSEESAKPPQTLKAGLLERAVRKVKGEAAEASIRIEDIDDIVFRFARCCNPVPGDAVTGWITRGRGVTVHRRECPKAMELDPERRVDISWTKQLPMSRPVSLRITAADRPGILAAMSAAFSASGVNINRATCESPTQGRAVNHFEISVSDSNKLRALMRSISKIDGVYDVERV